MNFLTPEMVRKLCRELGGSTNAQAADVQDACERLLSGGDIDQVIADIRRENGE